MVKECSPAAFFSLVFLISIPFYIENHVYQLAKTKKLSELYIWSIYFAVQTPHILFTGLEDYKTRGTQAAPYLTSTFYTEFAETKDLVLIRGDIVFTSKLTDEEGKWLLETTLSFYLNDTRYKLVEHFNKQTRDFEFRDVLQALDMPIL